jgi:hypothetical protein
VKHDVSEFSPGSNNAVRHGAFGSAAISQVDNRLAGRGASLDFRRNAKRRSCLEAELRLAARDGTCKTLRCFGCGPPSGGSPAPPQAREFGPMVAYLLGPVAGPLNETGPDHPHCRLGCPCAVPHGAPSAGRWNARREPRVTMAGRQGRPRDAPRRGTAARSNVKGVSDFCCGINQGQGPTHAGNP